MEPKARDTLRAVARAVLGSDRITPEGRAIAIAKTLEEAGDAAGDAPLSEMDLVVGLLVIWTEYTRHFRGSSYLAEIRDDEVPMWHRARTIREIAEVVMAGVQPYGVDVRAALLRCRRVWDAFVEVAATREDGRSRAIADTHRREVGYLDL